MEKKKIKAIRIVLGFTDDLRVKLSYANRESIFNFLDRNRVGLFGLDSELANKPDPASDEWLNWESKMWKVVDEVIG